MSNETIFSNYHLKSDGKLVTLTLEQDMSVEPILVVGLTDLLKGERTIKNDIDEKTTHIVKLSKAGKTVCLSISHWGALKKGKDDEYEDSVWEQIKIIGKNKFQDLKAKKKVDTKFFSF